MPEIVGSGADFGFGSKDRSKAGRMVSTEASALGAPSVGLIVPPLDGALPTDAPLVYPQAAFEVVGLGLRRMEVGDYETASRRIVSKAFDLQRRGVEGICVMGTSLTFYSGKVSNDRIQGDVSRATGLPCVTMSTALVAGLRAVGSRRPVLASAYSPDVHRRLSSFLSEEGFSPLYGANMDITEISDLAVVSPRDVAELGFKAWEATEGAGDALVLSCGGFRTRGAMLLLEESLGVPVVSSAVAGLWAAVELVGGESRVPSLSGFMHDRPSIHALI